MEEIAYENMDTIPLQKYEIKCIEKKPDLKALGAFATSISEVQDSKKTKKKKRLAAPAY